MPKRPHPTALKIRRPDRTGLLCLFTAIALGVVAEPARADVESECQSVIQDISADLTDRHGVSLVSVSSGSVEDSGYEIPLSPSGEPFPRAYQFVLANGDEAESNRSNSFLNSPSLMGSYAQAISDQCRPASLVIFGLDRTGFRIFYGLNESGGMQPFECVDVDPDHQPEIREWGYDYTCNL